jgi:hypothetical protein
VVFIIEKNVNTEPSSSLLKIVQPIKTVTSRHNCCPGSNVIGKNSLFSRYPDDLRND